MLSYSELKPGKIILLDGEPFEVVATSGVVKKQRQKPHNTAKMRGVKTGSTVERTFTQADKIEEADITSRELKFIYANRGQAVFAEPNDLSKRMELPESILGDKLKYIKGNDIVEAEVFDSEIIGIKIPVKVELKVAEAPPNVKGNTAQGATKTVVLETGLAVTTPMFIETGDTIRVNTETGEYVERAS
jgi:elongation factor P